MNRNEMFQAIQEFYKSIASDVDISKVILIGGGSLLAQGIVDEVKDLDFVVYPEYSIQ